MSTIIVDTEPVFKICPMCNTKWHSMDAFLADPQLTFNGYQPNLGDLEQGLFFFTHDTKLCGSTIGLKVTTFAPIYSGPRYTGNKQFAGECPRYCFDSKNLNRCSSNCENAFAREISQIIKDRMNKQTNPDLCVHRGKTVPGVLELCSFS